MVGTLGWPSTHDIVMGMVGVLGGCRRFFHTVLRDNVMPVVAAINDAQPGTEKKYP